MFTENVCHTDDERMLPESLTFAEQSFVMQQECDSHNSDIDGLKKISEAQKNKDYASCSNMNTAEATVDEIEFENFNQMDRGGQAFFQRSRVWMLLKHRRLKKGYSVAVGLASNKKIRVHMKILRPKVIGSHDRIGWFGCHFKCNKTEKDHQLLFSDLAPVASLVTDDSV